MKKISWIAILALLATRYLLELSPFWQSIQLIIFGLLVGFNLINLIQLIRKNGLTLDTGILYVENKTHSKVGSFLKLEKKVWKSFFSFFKIIPKKSLEGFYFEVSEKNELKRQILLILLILYPLEVFLVHNLVSTYHSGQTLHWGFALLEAYSLIWLIGLMNLYQKNKPH